MLASLILIFTQIFCSEKYSTDKNEFYIVTDRPFQKVNMKYAATEDMQKIKFERVEMISDVIYDKHFPRTMLYKFDCQSFSKSKTPITFDIQGLSDSDEVLFSFRVNYDLKSMIFSDFQDSNNKPINNVLYGFFQNFDNFFMVSCDAKNVVSIEDSFWLATELRSLKSLIKNILKNLYRYDCEIFNFSEKLKTITDDQKILKTTYDARKSLVEITTLLLGCFACSKIPDLRIFGEPISADEFEKFMVKIFVSLKPVVEVFLNATNAGETEEGTSESKGASDEQIRDYIMKKIIHDNSLTESIQTYRGAITTIGKIFGVINNRKNLDVTNTEILSDCDISKVDAFVNAYSELFEEYMDVMWFSKNDFTFDSYFNIQQLSPDDGAQKLVDFSTDRYIAHHIAKFLKSYSTDKTDFLIFVQNDYFKYQLSSRIVRNLECLAKIYSTEILDKQIRVMFSDEYMQKRQYYFTKIIELTETWNTILKVNGENEVKTFDELLNEESLLQGPATRETKDVTKVDVPEGNVPEEEPSQEEESNVAEEKSRLGLGYNNPNVTITKPDVSTKPDGSTKPDVKTPKPDVKTPKPDGKTPKPDGKTPKPDVKTPKPDGKTPKPDDKNIKPDNQFWNKRALTMALISIVVMISVGVYLFIVMKNN